MCTHSLHLFTIKSDDNFEFNGNGKKFSKWVENTVGKGEIACYEQFLLFPQCFLKICTAEISKPGLVWEMVEIYFVCSLYMHSRLSISLEIL